MPIVYSKTAINKLLTSALKWCQIQKLPQSEASPRDMNYLVGDVKLRNIQSCKCNGGDRIVLWKIRAYFKYTCLLLESE